MSSVADERLLLLAQDAADLMPLSALVQDAVLAADDVAWDPRARRLVLLLSRFRWEAGDCSRVRAALRIEGTRKLQRSRWPTDRATPLALLSLSVDGGWLTLAFAGGAALRAQVECVELVLEDVSAPWPVKYRPDHP